MRFKNGTIGLLVAPGFDDSQVLRIARLLQGRGATVKVIGVGENASLAVYGSSGSLLKPDVTPEGLGAGDLDALIIPSRKTQNDLIADEKVLTLLIVVNALAKPVGAVGNGQLVMAAAGLLSGKRVTGDAGIREKLEEAGANYVDQELVVDRNLVTARDGGELDHFIDVIAFLLEPAPLFSQNSK